jgi:hypothetical protein
MDSRARMRWTQVGVVTTLAAGWLVGFGVHGGMAAATGWGDVPLILVAWGALLCAVAGAGEWVAAPAHRRPRFGALAGLAMFVSYVVGNVLIVLLWVDPVHLSEGGETWFTFLLESWFWVGLPVLVSLGLGMTGWLAVDRVGRGRPTVRA